MEPQEDEATPLAPAPKNGFGLPGRTTGAGGEEPLAEARDALATELIGMIQEDGTPVVISVPAGTIGEQLATVEAGRPKAQMDQIIRFMILNPQATVADTARHFGVTPAWMYTVTAGDMFKMKYARLLKELDSEHLLPTLYQRIVGTAHRALDRVNMVVDTASPELALDIYKAMARTVAPPPMGPAVVNNQNNQINLSIDARSAAITTARNNMLNTARKALSNG